MKEGDCNNQTCCEPQMCTNGIVGRGKNILASVCVDDIELPIVLVIIEFHLKKFQSVINEISHQKEVLILYGCVQVFTDWT